MQPKTLISRPEKGLLILQELPFLDRGITEGIRDAYARSKNHGYFGVHTIPEPGKPKSDEVFTSSVPKVMLIQNHYPNQVPGYFEDFEPYVRYSPIILITGEPDRPLPVPGSWNETFEALHELGLKRISLFGYEAVTLPYDLWSRDEALDCTKEDLSRPILDYHAERPELRNLPVLFMGCVLGAYEQILKARKKFGFEVDLVYELLNPGAHPTWERIVRERIEESLIGIGTEEQKISFSRDRHGTYTIFYDSSEVGKITYHELKWFNGQSEASRKWIIKYKLQAMHPSFSNGELATRIAELVYADYLSKTAPQ